MFLLNKCNFGSIRQQNNFKIKLVYNMLKSTFKNYLKRVKSIV